jgi:hypothetical protein
MTENVNTQDYWDQRFASGDWEAKKGRWQTESFARGQMKLIRLGDDFEGTERGIRRQNWLALTSVAPQSTFARENMDP